MGGFFGGFLGVINAIGGGVLHALIGSKAWNDNESGRHYRLEAGGIAIGLVMGGILYAWLLDALFDEPLQGFLKFAVCFVLPPLLLLIIVEALEKITNEVSK